MSHGVFPSSAARPDLQAVHRPLGKRAVGSALPHVLPNNRVTDLLWHGLSGCRCRVVVQRYICWMHTTPSILMLLKMISTTITPREVSGLKA